MSSTSVIPRSYDLRKASLEGLRHKRISFSNSVSSRFPWKATFLASTNCENFCRSGYLNLIGLGINKPKNFITRKFCLFSFSFQVLFGGIALSNRTQSESLLKIQLCSPVAESKRSFLQELENADI